MTNKEKRFVSITKDIFIFYIGNMRCYEVKAPDGMSAEWLETYRTNHARLLQDMGIEITPTVA